MKLMDWNIEWMNNWFVGNGEVAWRQSHHGIESVASLAQRVSNLIRAVDPDVLAIQEGPSDPREMDLFINNYLAGGNGEPLYRAFGGIDGGAQKVYTLVKADGALKNARLATDEMTAGMLTEWMADVDGDAQLEEYEFTRDPLVVDGEINDSGETVRIVNLHTKSKFVNRQRDMWEDPTRRQEFIIAALKNRRRISTEAMHMRLYLDKLYDADSERLVIVTGDFNDGPGFDYFEKHYLTHGVADIIIGSSYRPDRQYKHALISNVPTDQLYTARFDDFIENIRNRPLLLDHVLVSPALRERCANTQIAHAEYTDQVDNTRPEGARDMFPSDHRPVVVEII